MACEVLKLDWLKNNKHSWHILGVHGFPGHNVMVDSKCPSCSSPNINIIINHYNE